MAEDFASRFIQAFQSGKALKLAQGERADEKEFHKARLKQLEADEKIRDILNKQARQKEARETFAFMETQPGTGPLDALSSELSNILQTQTPELQGAPIENIMGGQVVAPPTPAIDTPIEAPIPNVRRHEAMTIPGVFGPDITATPRTREEVMAEQLQAMRTKGQVEARIEQAKNMITIPPIEGLTTQPVQVDKRLQPLFQELLRGQTSRDVAATGAESREEVAKIGAASRERAAGTAAGSRRDVAEIGAASRERAAGTAAGSRRDVAEIGAESREKTATIRAEATATREQQRQLDEINEERAILDLPPLNELPGTEQEFHLESGAGKVLPAHKARQYFDLAGGDKAKARKMAGEDGWRF